MKFVDEYRDPVAARHLVARIDDLAGDGHYKFMPTEPGRRNVVVTVRMERPATRCAALIAIAAR